MNVGLLMNLYGRFANLMTGARLCEDFGDVQAFKYYSQDFLSITEKEIEEAFDFMLSRLRGEIWGIISREQKNIEKSTPEENSKLLFVGEIPDLMRMIFDLIRSCR